MVKIVKVTTSLRLHKFDNFFTLGQPNPNRKNFGRPVKKQSRKGQRGLNKCGHRKNKTR